MALPGVRTVLRDNFYPLTRTDAPAGPRVALIAGRTNTAGTDMTRADGSTFTTAADYDPYEATDGRYVCQNFCAAGLDAKPDSAAHSPLHRAYVEAVAGGASRISLVPIPAASWNQAGLESTADGNAFDKAFDAAEIAQPDVIVPWGRGGHPDEFYDSDNPVPVTASSTTDAFTATAHGFVEGDVVQVGGTTPPGGTTVATDYYVINPTTNTFQLAATPGGTAIDLTSAGTYVTVAQNAAPFVGFTANNDNTKTNSFARRVADKCQEISGRSYPVIGVLGVKPFQGVATNAQTGAMSAADLQAHLGLTGLINHASETLMGDHGGYLSVVAVEMRPVGYASSWGYANGAAHYAGAVASMDSWQSSTGRTIYNVAGLRYVPNRPQQEALIAKGVVPVSQNFNRVATWVDGLTFARPESDFVRLTTLRITFDALSLVRRAAQRFVGQPSTLHHRNSLETAITSALNGMQKQGALQGADHRISYVPRESKAIIDLVLRPAFEMRNIEISVSVQL